MDIQKILVPVDFSSCSRNALEFAASLAERYLGASVDVLHVWEPLRSGNEGTANIGIDSGMASIDQTAKVQAMKDMESLMAEHEVKGIVPFRRLHESGEAVPTILDMAKRAKYDLIVMGTHGRTGMAHEYLGSVAEKVVRSATCPLITIREKPPAQHPETASAERVQAGL